MSQSRVDLDRIAVASPCPVAWEDMAGDERVRFCNQCNLNVYNISAMTRHEAASFIANVEGRICARYYRRADGAILTRDCPVGLRAIRKRVSRATAAVFSTLVSLFGGSATFAQQREPKNEPNVDVQRSLRRYGQAAIEGRVFDILRFSIPNTDVKLINEQTKQEITTRTNDSGGFRFTDFEPGVYTIQIESPGFVRLKYSGLKIGEDEALNLKLTLKVGEILGEVVIVPPPTPTNDTTPSGELKRKD